MRILCPIMLILVSGSAQIMAAPLDDVAVTPLAGPASCYAGTSGTDHVMFLKAKTSQADCDAIGGGSPCLARREFAGDGPNGRPVSLLAAPIQRPSVTGAGEFVAFTEYGFNICFMATAAEDTEGCFGRDFLGIDPHSVSISPAGTQIAITRLDPDNSFTPTNDVFVVDVATFGLLQSFDVITADPGGLALQVETVDFTVDGDYLIVDAFNPFSGLWGIYALSRSTGATLTVVAPVPGLHIRNPALAQTSDDHIVFDAQNPVTFENTVFAANLLTGALSQVASTAILAYPSYTGDDSNVVFDDFDAGVVSQASLDIQPLAADRLTPAGARTRWLNDGGVPEIYRRGVWSGTLLPPASCAPDADGDGITDSADNCTQVTNANQRDTDTDGIGNICDPDVAAPNDCIVNFLDLNVYRANFFQAGDLDTDNNGDGQTNFVDLNTVRTFFFLPPGPSAVGCN